ncbi:MAG: DUF1846 domain-containing protein [Clostridiales bacterium]|nr:DUF1846 domain-containing protein [Clostridiales bacterium]MBQ3046738.1 DUF1846 domain-containing protein [Clostridia bacterium]
MEKRGFDNAKYLEMQSAKILERIATFGDKLYLEFGGKLFDDYHAARVLPGFEPDSKIKMLSQLKDQAEILIVINSGDIEKNKHRSDLGITYDLDVLRLIDIFKSQGFYVGSVVLTRFAEQPSAVAFSKRLEMRGIKVYKHYPIEGYPSEVEKIVSDDGFGKNEFVVTTRPLVVVTAPGPGSGKMATCLSQLYHENKRGVKAGYAKYETFPVWNLPLNHPVNAAYEAATADLNDMNMIDPFHLEAYGQMAVNYNRDVEVFPVLSAMLQKVLGESPYKSPTDMGVNMAGYCIIDDEVVQKASRQEIIRRYYAAQIDVRKGLTSKETISKIEILMQKMRITINDREVVAAALEKEATTGAPGCALQLTTGEMVTGKTGKLLGASAAALLNALKVLGGVDDSIDLISSTVIKPIQELKVNHMGSVNPRLHTDEILLSLAVSAATDPTAKIALDQLSKLEGAQLHSSVILSAVDEMTLKKLGINVTCEPKRQSSSAYAKN